MKASHEIQGHEDVVITLKFELVPSDMKWLATFSGELSNAAMYPSSLANVKKDNLSNVHGSLGNKNTSNWQPWLYDHRVKVVKLVTDYESKIAVNKSPKQQRNLVTKFISGKHSRQEFLPFVGPAIDKAKCEPIHLGNNCWQEWNKQVMTIALTRTNTDPAIATVDQLPFDCCFRRYFRAVKNQVRSRKLYKKILKWFREDRKEKKFPVQVHRGRNPHIFSEFYAHHRGCKFTK